MVLPFERYFAQERHDLERWSACLLSELTTGQSSCQPYDLSQGYPVSVFGLCVLYSIGLVLFIRRFVAIPVAKLALTISYRQAPLAARPESLKTREFRHKKFVGSFVEFWLYTINFIVGGLLLYKQPWNWPSKEWWQDTPTRDVDASVMIFGMFYAARYCAMLFSLTVLEPRKKDFFEMLLHHLVTVALVNLAMAYGYVRIALVVMVVFDAADPFLHMAKMINYMKQAAGSQGDFPSYVWFISQITDAFLACFAIVFTVTRIFVYSYIVYSVSIESYRYTRCAKEECAIQEGLNNVSFAHHICVLLIWIINFLQWFWFKLLVKVIYRTVVEGVSEDNRSDASSQEDGDVKGKTSTKPQARVVPLGTETTSDGESEGEDDKKTK